MKRRISTILLILALASTVWAAPNIGGGTARSGTGLAVIGPQVVFVPSATSGEAPLAVDFTIQIYGTSLGAATWFYVLCNDDGGNILPNTGIVALQAQNAYSSTYVTDGFCIYESAGAKTARLWYEYRGSINSADADITVTESVGSIDVQLEVEPLISTETTDLTMTAEVTGEAGNNIDCRFWCDCASPGAEWAGGGACGAHDDVGDGPAVSPDIDVVFDHADHACANDVIPGDCAVPGECVAAVVCQRNAQEDTAYVPYTIYPDTISIQSFTATPASGTNPLDDVVLEAAVTTTCDSTGNIQFQFDCDVGSGVDDNDTVAIADYVDENGLITFASDDVGADDCDGYAASTTATVVVDCENAVQAAAATPIEIVVGTTFSFESSTSPSGGVEPLNTVHPWVGAWGGTATGDITIDSVDCNTGLGNTEGVDYFSAGYNIGDLSSAYNLFQQGISCDYATDAVYEGDVDATRDGVSFTTTFYVTVTPQSTAPIFQLSETSFNRTAVVGANANDVVFTVGNVGGGNLEWVGVDDATWLACTPDDYTDQAPVAGPANGESEEITCTITSSTLGTGSYSATVTYTDPNATPTTPDTPVTVNLNVTEPVSTPIHLEVDLNLATTGGSIASGPSPLAVSFSTVDISDGVNHVDYTGDTSHEDSTVVPFTDLYYEWDFGDAGCPQGDLGDCRWDAVATNRLSRNYMTGPLGAHVYEPATFPDTCTGAVACKIYYPTLRVTDEDGNLASWSGTVNVYDPDATGANGWGDASETACVFPQGDVIGDGCPGTADATHPTAAGHSYTYESPANDFDDDLTTLIDLGYNRILFKGGETFDMNEEYHLEHVAIGVGESGLIGAYGTGDVIVDLTLGYDEDGINISADNWRIQDITFTATSMNCTGWDAGDDFIFISDAGLTQTAQVQNLLIQRTTAVGSDICGGLAFSSWVADNGRDSQAHRQIFLVDNEWSGIKLYTVYGTMNGLSMLGNTLAARSGAVIAKHTVRIESGRNVLVSNNLISGSMNDGSPGNYTGCAIQYRDFPMENCSICSGCTANSNCKPFCGKPLRYYVTQDNDFMMKPPCGISVGGRMCGEETSPNTHMPQSDFIFERNYFYPHIDGFDRVGNWTEVISTAGSDINDRFSNTVIRNNVSDHTGFWGVTRYVTQAGNDVDYYNNTCYRSDSRTDTAYCMQSASSGECRNNVFYAPNYAGTVDWNWSTCTTESTNFDSDTEGSLTSDPFGNPTPTRRWHFWPNNALLQNQATEVPTLFDDAINTCGDRGDAGALEYPYAAGDGAVDGVPGCR